MRPAAHLPGRAAALLLAAAMLVFLQNANQAVAAEESTGTTPGASPRSAPQGGMHWAFSAFFGSGWYEVANAESVFVLRAPLVYSWRSSSWNEGQRGLGVELHYPLTMGLHHIDSIDDFTDTDNFGSVAFTPGIELEIPVTQKWYLRPLLNVGWGTETHGGESAWIYYGGIKSRYTPMLGKLDWSLLNALYRAGYRDESGDQSSLTLAMAGAEFHHPLQSTLAGRDDLQVNWHLTYSWMFDEAEFSLWNGFSQSVSDQWELGIALAPRHRKFKMGFLVFEQLGLSFRTSSDGEYRAISINASSPFH